MFLRCRPSKVGSQSCSSLEPTSTTRMGNKEPQMKKGVFGTMQPKNIPKS
ncbi:hypothetical protein HanIR_Chr11g0544091 [Helianthus annuus]|nr:hypothetical protein HanIR_Chr11g0544091 [Helianthus annuus]